MYEEGHYKQVALTLEFQPIDLSRDCGFTLGNAIKYILRAGSKGSVTEDLVKARDYLNFMREDLEKNFQNYEFRLTPPAIVAAMNYCKKNKLLDTLFGNYTMPRDWYEKQIFTIELDDVKNCIYAINEVIDDINQQ